MKKILPVILMLAGAMHGQTMIDNEQEQDLSDIENEYKNKCEQQGLTKTFYDNVPEMEKDPHVSERLRKITLEIIWRNMTLKQIHQALNITSSTYYTKKFWIKALTESMLKNETLQPHERSPGLTKGIQAIMKAADEASVQIKAAPHTK
jgi:hypothetical protein